jgi:hypothetical protein
MFSESSTIFLLIESLLCFTIKPELIFIASKVLIQIMTKECVDNLAHGPATYFIREEKK